MRVRAQRFEGCLTHAPHEPGHRALVAIHASRRVAELGSFGPHYEKSRTLRNLHARNRVNVLMQVHEGISAAVASNICSTHIFHGIGLTFFAFVFGSEGYWFESCRTRHCPLPRSASSTENLRPSSMSHRTCSSATGFPSQRVAFHPP